MAIARYSTMKTLLTYALHDLRILSGEIAGPSGATWQDIAGTCATNLEALASQLHSARKGNSESFITFPNPAECLEDESKVEYEVVCGNVGSVYSGPDELIALQKYETYVEASQSPYGRPSGEEVILFRNAEIWKEYQPPEQMSIRNRSKLRLLQVHEIV